MNRKIITVSGSLPRIKGHRPYIRLPKSGVLYWEDEPSEWLALKASGVCTWERQRTVGNRNFALNCIHKILHALSPSAEAII